MINITSSFFDLCNISRNITAITLRISYDFIASMKSLPYLKREEKSPLDLIQKYSSDYMNHRTSNLQYIVINYLNTLLATYQ